MSYYYFMSVLAGVFSVGLMHNMGYKLARDCGEYYTITIFTTLLSATFIFTPYLNFYVSVMSVLFYIAVTLYELLNIPIFTINKRK